MTDSLAARVAARLGSLNAAGLSRTLQPPTGLDLSSNDYLGLARDPRVIAAFTAAGQGGCGSTGSRLLRGDREAFHAVERQFAAFKRVPRALYFSSGYLANLAVITTLAEKGDRILSDARNHASLIDAVRLSGAERVIVPHRDTAALAQGLEAAASVRAAGGQVFVVTESVFSMDGDEAPLDALRALCAEHQATLVVDEAHAVGVFGTEGAGLLDAPADGDPVTLSVNSAGKALGVAGAFVAGPAWAIEYLVQRARPFVFSTAPPPAVADAIVTSLAIVTAEPERRRRLFALAAHLRRALSTAGLSVAPDRSAIVPIQIGDNDQAVRVAQALQDQGFDIRAIRPPTVPPGTARLRLSVNTSLTESDLDRFVAGLVGTLEKLTLWPVASS